MDLNYVLHSCIFQVTQYRNSEIPVCFRLYFELYSVYKGQDISHSA